MKKTLRVFALIAIVTIITINGVKAASSSTLANDLYTKLSAYGLTSADKVKVERYVADHNVTDAQAAEVLAQADAVVAVMKAEGVTEFKKLSAAGQAKVKADAQAAASAVGLTLTFTNNSAKLYDANGKLIETITSNGKKLSYTGNNINTILVVSSIAVLALAATVVTKKSFKVEA